MKKFLLCISLVFLNLVAITPQAKAAVGDTDTSFYADGTIFASSSTTVQTFDSETVEIWVKTNSGNCSSTQRVLWGVDNAFLGCINGVYEAGINNGGWTDSTFDNALNNSYSLVVAKRSTSR
mgnify:CR=1 FL=1